MATEHLVPAADICINHHVEYSFISGLYDAGLIEITIIDESSYIHETELQKLERMINLHHELDINIPGIEAITHLLQRIEHLQDENRALRNRLKLYEELD